MGTSVLCAGITVYRGLKESGARAGQSIAIVGAGGGLGSLACQYAKAMGLRIIAVDAGDEKKAMTEKLGASAFIDFSKSKNVVSDVQAATEDGFGPQAVLLVAVNEKPFQQAAEVREIPTYSLLDRFTKTRLVCPPPWHRRRHRPTSWRLPPRSRLRIRHQDGNHQRFLCRQPTRHGRGH